MTDELKPVKCGCGGEAKVIMLIPDVYAVECSKCWIRTGSPASTEAEAITAWNMAMGTDVRTLMKVFAFDATCAVCKKKKERTAKVEVNYRDESVIFGFCECGQAVNTYSTYCPHCGCRLIWGED